MIDIVADIGGTNARIGLARGGRVDPASVRRYRNADFPDFGALIAAHVAAAGGQRRACRSRSSRARRAQRWRG